MSSKTLIAIVVVVALAIGYMMYSDKIDFKGQGSLLNVPSNQQDEPIFMDGASK